MKAPPFRYTRVDDADHAVERLSELGEDAKLLAGGQSLLPMMSFRLVRPSWLVDVSRADDLRGFDAGPDGLRIGALTRHRELASVPGCPVVSETVPLIAHEPIRWRGTFGGSIAHGDPAAEWCVAAVLLDGEIAIRGPRGERTVTAEGFFHALFVTDLAPDELLAEIRLRPPRHAALCEHAPRRGDFALALAGAAFGIDDGRCVAPRLVAGGVDAVPVRLAAAERTLADSAFEPEAVRECAAAAAAEVDPADDVHASADDRRRLVAALVERAIGRAREVAA